MIPVPSGVKVWLATGYTDMRRGFLGLSLMREMRCVSMESPVARMLTFVTTDQIAHPSGL
ncbi:hypothetical protein EKH55_3942 [Sinorhizobium alkalisoli]|nr:hypothetical protein EKH55_3942 [Sinorhizobium alkalisoli]